MFLLQNIVFENITLIQVFQSEMFFLIYLFMVLLLLLSIFHIMNKSKSYFKHLLC